MFQFLEDMCVGNYMNAKPVIRIIHHFACTGGTLISKCIAALPNTFVLSELNPISTLHINMNDPKFLPSDVTTQARVAGFPFVNDLAKKIFSENISLALSHINSYGGNLVLRDHSHSDYCVEKCSSQMEKSTIYNCLIEKFDIKRIVTVRDPIDSFISLIANNWLHFEPNTFEEYCRRYLLFIDQFELSNIIYYEDFVENPQRSMRLITEKLDLEYNDQFIECYGAIKMSGDSGRKSQDISERKRREIGSDLMADIQSSKSYNDFQKRLNKYLRDL